MKWSLIVFLSLLLMSGCKSYKKTTYGKTHHYSEKRFLKQLLKNAFSAKTFESRIKIDYKDSHQNISGNGKIRILKDSIIWGSINFMGIPMIKFYISPSKILYYNKIDKTYYNGNFSLIEKQLEIPVNYNYLQNLLLGDLIIPLTKKDIKMEIKDNYYDLYVQDPYLKEVKITPFFKVLSEVFTNQNKYDIEAIYSDYENIQNHNLPKIISIYTPDKSIKLYYKNIILNKNLRFPFQLPNNYSPIKL